MGGTCGRRAPRYSARYRRGEPDLFRHENGVNEGAVHIRTISWQSSRRPSSPYYFVGSQADNLFYLDLHHTSDVSVATAHTDF